MKVVNSSIPRLLRRLCVGFSAFAALMACSRAKPTGLPKDDVVVARVNGTTITAYDLDQAAQRSLGSLAVESVQRAAHAKLLESAIQSRALALAAEKELSPLDRQVLDKEVATYREQLLVRRYVNRHTPPAPVTPEMIANYYQSHPERFGGGTERHYELIGASRGLSPDERTKVLAKLQDAAKEKDWKTWAGDLEAGGLPVTFSTAVAGDKVLHPKLRELLASLQPQQPSAPVFVDGRPYVARISGEQARSPRPLDEVRGEIVRTLTPVQLSAALEKAAAEVMKNAKVEILEAGRAAAPAPPASLQLPRGRQP